MRRRSAGGRAAGAGLIRLARFLARHGSRGNPPAPAARIIETRAADGESSPCDNVVAAAAAQMIAVPMRDDRRLQLGDDDERKKMPTSSEQCANAVLMVRPAAFDYNPETAASNRMQRVPAAESPGYREAACTEFAQFVLALESEGVRVCVVDDTNDPPKPDAVFPNNWISFHADGTVVLYPMHAASRRFERRRDVIDAVAAQLGFRVRRIVDLTAHERDGRALEGTGSLVLDHVERVAYACRSPRTHPAALEEWCRELEYEPLIFDAADRGGVPFYHTNVLMSIGTRAVVVGAEAIASEHRAPVLARLCASGREVITITQEQVAAFAGNMLELASWDEALGDCSVLVMSSSARAALGRETYARLAACADTVLAAPIPTIEHLGGGSVRCMLAEVFGTA